MLLNIVFIRQFLYSRILSPPKATILLLQPSISLQTHISWIIKYIILLTHYVYALQKMKLKTFNFSALFTKLFNLIYAAQNCLFL